jgi:putative membrane protein insertion efficiency factor
MLLTAIDLYQRTLSSQMETAGVRCRFEPTCSRYAQAVIRRDGALEGSWRTLRRIARCGPWTPAGTRDLP